MHLSHPSSGRGPACSHGRELERQQQEREPAPHSLGTEHTHHYKLVAKASQEPSPDSRTIKSHWEKREYREGEKIGPFWQATAIPDTEITTLGCQHKAGKENALYSQLPVQRNYRGGVAWCGDEGAQVQGRGPGFQSGLAIRSLCFLRPTASSLGLSFFIYEMVSVPSRGLAALRFAILEYFNWSNLPFSIISPQQTHLA